ncbi:phytanoyl-CoA dioxygenase [Phlyctema vagabunda]|uniref:Phytanoyl-CoA dioxygenase n=1 Tax=Phlyctema vagabunda TaxID=108571 RepID=A0ABR4PTD6_9HELO
MQDPNPTVIYASEAEVAVGTLTQNNLEVAIRALHHDGIIIVENACRHESLDKLNGRMVEDASKLEALGDKRLFNFIKGNMQQNPPPGKEYFLEDVFLNPFVSQIVSTHLGPRPRYAYVSSNVALPVSDDVPMQSQPIHSDIFFKHPAHPFSLVVSIPLVTMSAENGSSEFWLGTHEGFDCTQQIVGTAIESSEGGIGTKRLEERRKVRGCCQPTVNKGGLIIRDLRLWHGGKPNMSKEPRVLLALIYFAPWYRNKMIMPAVESIRPLLEAHTELEIPVEYISDEEASEKYLERAYGREYMFDQVP